MSTNGDIELAATIIALALIVGAVIVGVSLIIAAGRMRKRE